MSDARKIIHEESLGEHWRWGETTARWEDSGNVILVQPQAEMQDDEDDVVHLERQQITKLHEINQKVIDQHSGMLSAPKPACVSHAVWKQLVAAGYSGTYTGARVALLMQEARAQGIAEMVAALGAKFTAVDAEMANRIAVGEAQKLVHTHGAERIQRVIDMDRDRQHEVRVLLTKLQSVAEDVSGG